MKFYKVCLDEGNRKKFAEAASLSGTISVQIDCKICNSKWVDSKFEKPIEIIFTNNFLPDYTSIIPENMVSERFKGIIGKYSLSNCSFEKIITKTLDELTKEQIKAFRQDGDKVNKFCTISSSFYSMYLSPGISIHRETNVIFDKCPICGYEKIIKKYDDGKSKYLIDIILDMSSWQGLDLFTIKEFPNYPICTERFIEVCKIESIKGMFFEEVEAR